MDNTQAQFYVLDGMVLFVARSSFAADTTDKRIVIPHLTSSCPFARDINGGLNRNQGLIRTVVCRALFASVVCRG